MLTGCGFKPRNDLQLSSAYQELVVSSLERYSPMAEALKKRFKVYKVTVLSNQTDTQQALPFIYIQPEQLDRRLLSLFPTGQVAEYELLYTLNYQVGLPGEEAQSLNLELRREYQDDPDQVLAKSKELELILKELRQEAADHIIRQLNVLSPR